MAPDGRCANPGRNPVALSGGEDILGARGSLRGRSRRIGANSTGFTTQRMMEKIFGRHSARAVFLTRPRAIRRVVLLAGKDPFQKEFADLARDAEIQPEILPLDQFLRAGRFTQEERQHKNQGVVLFTEPRTIYAEEDLDTLREARVVLTLDQVSNPQNLGMILRNAAFFHVDALLMMKNRSAELTPEVIRIAVDG